MTARPHRSIGEVLTLLQQDFPDITISKIRFLESQGLLDPERTPSGYRKFYERDITTLRWILEQQRDNFLPLKVIKAKLDDPQIKKEASTPPPESVDAVLAGLGALNEDDQAADGEPASSEVDPRTAMTASVSLTPDELATASKLDRAAIDELEKYAMLSSRTAGSTKIYDDDALFVAKLAAAFLERGLEPRHLRMYKLAADREADVFRQLVTPRHKADSASSRSDRAKTVEEMTRLGSELRLAMLRQSVRGTID